MRYLLVILASLAFAGTASAAPPTPTVPVPPPPTATLPPPSAPSTGGGLLGSPDTTQALGGTDASCTNTQGASAEVVKNCASTGLTQSAFPPSNYGTDTHVDTGLTDPANDVASIMQNFFGWIFGLMAHVLTWIFLGLGLAFSFDLFRSDKTGQIGHGLATAEHLFTFPLLPIFLIIGAIVGISYWFGQRQEGRAVAHWGTMVAMMIFALIIIQNPVGVFGWADTAANGIASGALSAFTGQGGGSSAGFANATPGLWKTTMEEPWCAMEFGSVSWCMGSIDPAMATARDQTLQHLPDALGDQAVGPLAQEQAPLEKERLAAAKTNGELFLSFIPNSDARNGQNDTWTLYHALLKDQPTLASIRGPGGVGERFVILLLAGVAGIFFLLLLAYIAWQLIVNSVFFVLCILLTPVVIFAPAFGESGRAVFLKWGVWTVEALIKKIIFAIYLGVILLISSIFLEMGSSLGGWLIEWLVLAGIWAMAFLYRHKILGVMTGGMYQHHGQPNVSYANRLRQSRSSSSAPPRPTTVVPEEVHHHEHAGDTYYQHAHAHVYQNGDRPGPRPESESVSRPEPVAVINGSAKELDE